MLMRMREAGNPALNIPVGATPAADIYILDEVSLAALRGTR
jgi:hypothetical protein